MSEALAVQPIIDRMVVSLRPYLERRPLMIGIYTGGVWVAQRLHEALGLEEPIGTLDISFYRDDFTRVGVHPQVKTSDLPVNIEDRHVILVDDILHTGRTIRAALNEIFDYGRPASVLLAVLVDRTGRELPVQPDVCGHSMSLAPHQHVKLVNRDAPELRIQEGLD
ncbi:MAG: bifunctional pyr operon transcriptional regulator/uracil phosphoribosyltransferase PyrR [Acidiferrobacteraceae bacterium]